MTNITDVKLGGAKRKNGHKPHCSCHICENIKNKAKHGGYEKEAELEKERMNGGSKKKNGHKINCECPICKNMKNAKKGDVKSCKCIACQQSGIDHVQGCKCGKCNKKGGSQKKRSNGHKLECKCPICKNMRKTKKGGDDNESNNTEMNVNDNNKNDNSSSSDSPIGDSLVNNNSSDGKTMPASEEDYEDLPLGESNGGTRRHKKGGKKWSGKTKKSKRRVRSRRHH